MESHTVYDLMSRTLPDIDISEFGGRYKIVYSYQSDYGCISTREKTVDVVREGNFFQIPELGGNNVILLVDRDIPFSDIKEGHVRMRSRIWRKTAPGEEPWQMWMYIKSTAPV